MTAEEFLDDEYLISMHRNKGGLSRYALETYGKDLEHVKNCNGAGPHIYTVVSEGEGLYILKGFHFVNRFLYLLGHSYRHIDESEFPIVLKEEQ